MGRGRQKAKHTKVARDLKYFSPDTNYGALERELSGNPRLEEDLEKWPEYSDDDAEGDDDLDEDESKTA
ncbi:MULTISPECIES: DUF3073 domain-containing protein [Schumannella]|jgi:hypothetical protein|uniref:DUF3073 domain-containing protein n=2 Tax=Schumannella TaxID=472058 RepID=A0A852YAI6_9MICO|nr:MULTISPECIES: DUF3073 domain-containing protein [Schumannella]NYG98294.1 hypothetical protein [Schumannella luteola]TPW77600.1 DUF3073 domain-containing protein [Schumannella soli]TPX05729.1 DUF3073 domain-containing protein [Schumannella luteola]